MYPQSQNHRLVLRKTNIVNISNELQAVWAASLMTSYRKYTRLNMFSQVLSVLQAMAAVVKAEDPTPFQISSLALPWELHSLPCDLAGRRKLWQLEVQDAIVWILNLIHSKKMQNFWAPHKLQSLHWISPLSCFSNTVKYFIFGMTELRGCSMHTYTHLDSANATMRQNLPRILGWSWLVRFRHRRLGKKGPARLLIWTPKKCFVWPTASVKNEMITLADRLKQVYLYT